MVRCACVCVSVCVCVCVHTQLERKEASTESSTGQILESRLIQKRGTQKRGKARASKLAGVEPVGRGEDMELLVGSNVCVLR